MYVRRSGTIAFHIVVYQDDVAVVAHRVGAHPVHKRSADTGYEGIWVAMDAETIDCTNLGDADLERMADLCAERSIGYEVGFLSKQAEAWVLVTRVHEGDKLRGFAFSTLERIGGTPSLLIGLASFVQTNAAEQALKAVMRNLYHRAVLAFPDEDVLVGTRVVDPSTFRALKGLTDIVPFPERKVSGEERAWGRRLAKRFGADGHLDDRTFILKGDGEPIALLDYSPRKPAPQAVEVIELFAGMNKKKNDSLVVFGWAMAEDLAGAKLPK